jgi:hypothetical protein
MEDKRMERMLIEDERLAGHLGAGAAARAYFDATRNTTHGA